MVFEWLSERYQSFQEFYNWTLTFADKRVEKWLLMGSPFWTLWLTVFYLITVISAIRFRHRLPRFELRPLLIVYNILLTLLNAYIFIQLIVNTIARNYNWGCQPIDRSYNKHEYAIAEALWWFYISKLFEFSDTMFFILRGRFRQISFLHVYHHATMFIFWWGGIKWVPGGSAYFGALMNSGIHILMYSYYGLSALFPNVNFWWKKYLTLIQLIQFVFVMIHSLRAALINPTCEFPIWMAYALAGYMLSFLVLFGNFWLVNYTRKFVEKGKKSKDSGRVPAAAADSKTAVNGKKSSNSTTKRIASCQQWLQNTLENHGIVRWFMECNYRLNPPIRKKGKKKANPTKTD